MYLLLLLSPVQAGRMLLLHCRIRWQWAANSSPAATEGSCAPDVIYPADDDAVTCAGWPHAVVTLQDSLAVGGNFLTSCHLGQHLAIWRLEQRLKVKPSCQYPGFRLLMWQGARRLLTRLQATAAAAAAAAGLGDLAAAKQQQQPAVGGVLYACELAGLPDLLQALQQWLDEANQQQQQQQQDGDAKRWTRGVEAVAAAAGAAAAAAAAGVPAGLDDPAGELKKVSQ
jgi:hypothetical protein